MPSITSSYSTTTSATTRTPTESDVGDYDEGFRITHPENLVPVTTLGRGSYGKVVLASITTDDGKEELVAVKVVAKSRLKARAHVEKAISELNVMTQVRSKFLIQSLGAFRKSYLIKLAPTYPTTATNVI